MATNHRLISAQFDLFALLRGWKTPLNAYEYPVPIKVSRDDTSRDELFAKVESEWTKSLDPTLFKALIKGDSSFDDLVEEKQETFLQKLTDLCVQKAGIPSTRSHHKNIDQSVFMTKKVKRERS